MLIFITIISFITFGVFATLLHSSKQRGSAFQRKYQLIITLRQLLILCRKYRSATHSALIYTTDPKNILEPLNQEILKQTNHLISIAHFNNKPDYRILQMRLTGLGKDWHERTVARNQVIHGAAMRHCMYLMDEIAMAWLAESGREDLRHQYHVKWQQVIDSMEALTQLRISIQDMDTQAGILRTQYRCTAMCRKLNQLSIISPYSMASQASHRAIHQLEEMTDNPKYLLSADQLYALTSEISVSITSVYDHILSELTEGIYLPLPTLEASQECQ
ncbi:hypothetical protein [Vibrio genomosp. F10]|uniref:Nitrate/nitrite sensing protein domain-containing protein n=2 Tax=Vibrio genomosp. F10 TaxID=723171 RepID=A0A1B9R017_9VIBR|nr:hypothetical protein [Vibrio genomosp. F10]OCH76920.1 hypothetical protein A6E14_08480 [Vibrio genomosp. F10]OEE31858.1 hypothetical protein A1QO_12685 [Vibrio genomosp. F10 str. ZF-129]